MRVNILNRHNTKSRDTICRWHIIKIDLIKRIEVGKWYRNSCDCVTFTLKALLIGLLSMLLLVLNRPLFIYARFVSGAHLTWHLTMCALQCMYRPFESRINRTPLEIRIVKHAISIKWNECKAFSHIDSI